MDYILIKGIPAFEAGHLHNFLDGIVLGCIEFFGAGQITQFYFFDRLRFRLVCLVLVLLLSLPGSAH